ncbi:MAG: hypothetical protein ACREKE_03225 [bacterium]
MDRSHDSASSSEFRLRDMQSLARLFHLLGLGADADGFDFDIGLPTLREFDRFVQASLELI